MSDTLEDRVTRLESHTYRHETEHARLNQTVGTINTKLDDLSGQARETRLSVRELSDRIANVEARLDSHGELLREHGELLREHGELLRRIVTKLEA